MKNLEEKSIWQNQVAILDKIKEVKEQLKVLEAKKKEIEKTILQNFNEEKINTFYDKETNFEFSISTRKSKKVNVDFIQQKHSNIYNQFLTFNESEFKKTKDPELKALIKNQEADFFIIKESITGIKAKKVEAVEITKEEQVDLKLD